MKVSDLVDIVALLSFGRDSPTQKERETYLKFLNLANMELYQIAAAKSRALVKQYSLDFTASEDETVLPTNVPLPDDFYFLRGVIAKKQSLEGRDVGELHNIEDMTYIISSGQLYMTANTMDVRVVDTGDEDANTGEPITKNVNYVTLLYVPDPLLLVEEKPQDSEDVTDTVVYPYTQCIALIHGALYYSCYANKGFVEKMSYQYKKWEDAKLNLASYYEQEG